MKLIENNLKTEIVNFGNLKPGDRIVGSDGKPVTVTNVYEKHLPKKMFELEMEDGKVIKASGNHLWYCETELDKKNQDEYRKLAIQYFKNEVIPEKVAEDDSFPLDVMIQLFGENINVQLFIEMACKSMGYSNYISFITLTDKLKTQIEEKVYQYSYNDLIDFLHKMKLAILENQGYFYFGQVRTTEEIFNLINKGLTVNIPTKKEIMDG